MVHVIDSGRKEPVDVETGEILDDLWAKVLAELQQCLPAPAFDTWLQGTDGRLDGDVLTVTAPNSFVSEMLERRMYSMGAQAVAKVLGRRVEVSFESQGATRNRTYIERLSSPGPLLKEMDEPALAKWMVKLGVWFPEELLDAHGADFIAEVAVRLFGPRGDTVPPGCHSPGGLLTTTVQRESKALANKARRGIIDLPSA